MILATIMNGLAVAYGVANLAVLIGAVFCLAFGKDDARFGGDKLIYRS
ncbi:MAG: hypothetical protein ACM3S5_15785 [Rhodospirillales bacterium]